MTGYFKFKLERSHRPELTTIGGLKNEVYTAVWRYFAPVVAIYGELEKTAGMPTAWQQRKLDKDNDAAHK
jgi:hypothetical protein